MLTMQSSKPDIFQPDISQPEGAAGAAPAVGACHIAPRGRDWTASGTILGANLCPAPSVRLTAFTVSWGAAGMTRIARQTVTSRPDGRFSFSFPWWDMSFCWPCEPMWWLCWPWWWEHDILHVIEALEAACLDGAAASGLPHPDPKALIRGAGFAGQGRAGEAGRMPAGPDPARTALIARKLSDPRLRAVFPWRWWCWSEPNVVFGATQAGRTILDETTGTDTRWAMQSGETVTLVGNGATLTASAETLPRDRDRSAWRGVGRFVVGGTPSPGAWMLDEHGLGQAGGDTSDMAFAGFLSLQATLARRVACYQANAAVWSLPPFRTAFAEPGEARALCPELWQAVWVFDPDSGAYAEHAVKMGPFALGGLGGLYATTAWREQLPAACGLPPFPANPARLPPIWGDPNLVLQADAGLLLGGGTCGAVDVTLACYDAAMTRLAAEPPPMRVMIDTTPLAVSAVEEVAAYTDRACTERAEPRGASLCPCFVVGPHGAAVIRVTVRDASGFLLGYEVEARFGDGSALPVDPPARGYVTRALNAGAAPDYIRRSWIGGSEALVFPGKPAKPGFPLDCRYVLSLRSAKRVTDGTSLPTLRTTDARTVELRFSVPG